MQPSFPKKTMRDVPLEGKIALVRADYNVPLNKDGTIANDFRIIQSLPTLQHLLLRGCKVVVCAHLGRPEGKSRAELSLEPVAARLSELLGQQVVFVPASTGDQVRQAVKQADCGNVVLLENLRFQPQEEANDEMFAKSLAKDSGAGYFVQDGFGVVHRAHASTDAITHFLPSVAGLLLEREYSTLTEAMENPKHPLAAVLGGAKVSDKLKIIERFVDVADKIIIGGAMANTFLQYKGYSIGKSVHEEGMGDVMRRIYEKASAKVGEDRVDEFIILPIDVVVGKSLEADEKRRELKVDKVADDDYVLDIGTESIERAVAALQGTGTVVWNGTMGYAELEQYSHGSARIALQLAQQRSTTSIIGGGDTVDFVLDWDAKKGGSFTHVSTGGGASLELMSGDKLPGVEALMNA